MRIKAIIVDDENKAITVLQELLEEYNDITLLGSAGSVDEALPLVLEKKPDLVFMDVQMPKKNGFELLHELRDFRFKPAIIFVTAFDEYAISAIRHAAFDYLLKPVDPQELMKAIHRLRANLNGGNVAVGQYPDITLKPVKVRFPFRARTLFIDPQDIISLHAEGNYTELFLTGGQKQMVSLYISETMEKLPAECFLRISRSEAISLKYLTSLDRKKRTCTLKAEGKEYVFRVPVRYLRLLDESLG
ncbi:MAG: response regulator transcription factor [Bacteroidales bacterium]|nr:response regulator transcription factor [Bacteroidales bacterium]